MKTYRRWFYISVGVVLVMTGTVGLGNYVMDPYGLFRTDFSKQFVEPNKNFIKTRYVAENPGRFDCFVFGSSRVNGIDVRHIKNAHCYNMHYSGGLPRNHLDILRYWLAKGVKPKIVLIGLDDISFEIDPVEQLSQPQRHPYPPVLHQSLFLYHLKYLFSMFDKKIRNPVINGFMGKEKPVPYDHYNTGLVTNPEVDRDIEQDPTKHQNDPKFSEPFSSQGEHMNGALEDLRNTVELAKAHGIRLIIFINPIHRTTYLYADPEQFFRFEKKLSQITDFWDFSGLNSVTTNNYYYYETSHYRPIVGDMIIARIFGEKDTAVPADFGVLVTPENIEQHLEALRRQVRQRAG